MSKILLEAKNITKTYTQGDVTLEILKGLNLELKEGEIVALSAPSGTGKSTLLHILGMLDHFDSGEIHVFGERVDTLDEDALSKLRLNSYGFVYQAHHLLQEFTALENIMMPLLINDVPLEIAAQKATQALSIFNLQNRANHRPLELSGGEQQRVSILRSIVHSPKILLADEPTGNLDYQTSNVVFEELKYLIQEMSLCALIATHNRDLAKKMHKIAHLEKGHLKFE